MLEKVEFCSRAEAIKMAGNPHWSIISIVEPWTAPARLQPDWRAILRLEFLDTVDDGSWQTGLFDEGHARQIIGFVDDAIKNKDIGIIVHCWAGVSRSAAVAKWIAGLHGLSFNEEYKLYNPHVYRKLCECSHGG